jgi:hypothetical protein
MPRIPFALLVLLPLALGALGCTGDEEGEGLSCPGESSCGGDPVGEWVFAAACSPYELGYWFCEEERSTLRVTVRGPLRLAADGTFEGEMDRTTRATLELPRSCMPGDAEELCGQVDELYAADGSCTMGTDACRCTESASGVYPLSGTWSIRSPGRLVLDEDEFDYCVSGDRLDIRLVDEEGSGAHYVLTRAPAK